MEPELTCLTCRKSFTSEERLAYHKEIVHRKRICAQCGKVYIDKPALIRHISSIHGDGNPNPMRYECDFCSATFKQLYTRIRHIKRKHTANVTVKKYECSKCGKMLSTKHNKQQHESFNCPYVTRREELSDWDDDSSPPFDFPVHAAAAAAAAAVVAAAAPAPPQTTAASPPQRNPLLLVRKERLSTSSTTNR